MIAYSSSAQISYIFLALGLGSEAGMDGGLLSDSGPRHDQIHDLRGRGGDDPGLRRPLLG